tara:strand:- start:24 stop:332 length:309 start_codon:yes stop_codon:yes gene_type:complete
MLVESIFIPCNNSLSSDPFRRLINKDVPAAEQENWNQINVINKSPGCLTIHIACAIKRYIRKEKIYLFEKSTSAYHIYCSKKLIRLGGIHKNIMQLQSSDML